MRRSNLALQSLDLFLLFHLLPATVVFDLLELLLRFANGALELFRKLGDVAFRKREMVEATEPVRGRKFLDQRLPVGYLALVLLGFRLVFAPLRQKLVGVSLNFGLLFLGGPPALFERSFHSVQIARDLLDLGQTSLKLVIGFFRC